MPPTLEDLMIAQHMHIQALFEIALESTDPDSVRRAVAGLQSSPFGLNYLAEHPLAV